MITSKWMRLWIAIKLLAHWVGSHFDIRTGLDPFWVQKGLLEWSYWFLHSCTQKWWNELNIVLFCLLLDPDENGLCISITPYKSYIHPICLSNKRCLSRFLIIHCFLVYQKLIWFYTFDPYKSSYLGNFRSPVKLPIFMSIPPVLDHPPMEEKREIKPWSTEEKQLFYEGFNKYYKRFNQISEMVSYLNCNSVIR